MSDIKAVIYTDGGCRPSRGIGGWAFFGYQYTNEPPKQGSGAKGMHPTEKGFVYNTQKDESNPEVTITTYIEGHGSLIPESTNNEAEIMALYRALLYVQEVKVTHVHFLIDSKYVLGGIQDWMPKWRSIRFVKPDGSEVANKDLWIKTDDLYQQLLQDGVNISFDWVKGHSGDIGNDMADVLATKGIVVGRNRVSFGRVLEREAKGYWNIDNSVHPLVAHTRWVFVDNEPTPTTGEFYRYNLAELGKSVEDSLLGKRMTDATFSCVYLKESVPVFEIIRDHYQSIVKNPIGTVAVARLDNVLKPLNYRDIEEVGGMYTQQYFPRPDLFDYNDNPLITEIKPTGLSLRALDEFQTLDAIMGFYFQTLDGNKPLTFCVTDVTEHFFDTEVVGKKKPKVKLKKHIDSTLKHIDLDVQYYHKDAVSTDKLRLLIGTDTIKRNNLSNLNDTTTKVSVVTWPESELAYRYATVVEYQGSYGIWCAVYANIKLVGL